MPGRKNAWHVTDSHIDFVRDKSEWDGTDIVFEIAKKGDKTEIRFTHVGLVPTIECYDGCSGAWGFYVNESLRNFIAKGKGQPNRDERRPSRAKSRGERTTRGGEPVTEYLLMTREDEHAHASQSPKAMSELIEKSATYAAELRRAGGLKDSGRLRPSKEGKRVRREGGRLEVQGGPFAERGKALGGYYWVQAKTFDEAAELAAKASVLPSDEIEVRPVMKGMCAKDKEAKPGKIFACGVFGSAKTEEAWVEVMDRVDEEAGGRFPEASFLGGLRLEPPRSGRRIVTRGERRATFDGPFLESKEVIGGLFFVRMSSIEDAVRWAAETPFVVHGALEIRELWRT